MAKDKEKRREFMRKLYRRRRAKIIKLLGGKCAKCGTTKHLQFDHIDHTEKSFPLGELLSHSWGDIFEEAKKCQLLCEIHHREKTYLEKSGDKNRVRGERVGTSKLKENEVRQIKQRIREGAILLRLAKEFHIDEKVIRLIKKNEIWKHVQI